LILAFRSSKLVLSEDFVSNLF